LPTSIAPNAALPSVEACAFPSTQSQAAACNNANTAGVCSALTISPGFGFGWDRVIDPVTHQQIPKYHVTIIGAQSLVFGKGAVDVKLKSKSPPEHNDFLGQAPGLYGSMCDPAVDLFIGNVSAIDACGKEGKPAVAVFGYRSAAAQ